MGEIFLLRHGQTAWSASGRHTGVTDIPLTADGEEQARRAGEFVRARCPRPAAVLTSPRRRARDTAALAGLSGAEVDPDLAEWDYGAYEGLTTAEIGDRLGRPWTVFSDGVAPGETPGETAEQVGRRAAAVLARVRPTLAGGDVVLVSHGHLLRILAAGWLGFPPRAGAHLVMTAGSVSVLGAEHDVPAITLWNVVPD